MWYFILCIPHCSLFDFVVVWFCQAHSALLVEEEVIVLFVWGVAYICGSLGLENVSLLLVLNRCLVSHLIDYFCSCQDCVWVFFFFLEIRSYNILELVFDN